MLLPTERCGNCGYAFGVPSSEVSPSAEYHPLGVGVVLENVCQGSLQQSKVVAFHV